MKRTVREPEGTIVREKAKPMHSWKP